jgi:hypothetical protein
MDAVSKNMVSADQAVQEILASESQPIREHLNDIEKTIALLRDELTDREGKIVQATTNYVELLDKKGDQTVKAISSALLDLINKLKALPPAE